MSDHINPRTGQPATHTLPTSSGYSRGWSREEGERHPTVWCGYCKASMPVTKEWAARYFDARLRRLENNIAAGYVSPRNEKYARQELSKEWARILSAIPEAEPEAQP